MAKRHLVKIVRMDSGKTTGCCDTCDEEFTSGSPERRTAEQELQIMFEAHTCSPRLIADGNLKRCSICGYPFEPDVHPSMSVAFAEHLSKAHQPGQTSEDFSQAAVRVVREATKD
jgi:hypothetical protein